jgi:hypothetical protein
MARFRATVGFRIKKHTQLKMHLLLLLVIYKTFETIHPKLPTLNRVFESFIIIQIILQLTSTICMSRLLADKILDICSQINCRESLSITTIRHAIFVDQEFLKVPSDITSQ